MKLSRRDISTSCHAIPEIRYEPEGATTLTSFAGMVVFMKLFETLSLRDRLRGCFSHIENHRPAYEPWRITLILIVHFLIGYKRLRDTQYYCDDPAVLRVLGLNQFPDVSTLSRGMKSVDFAAVERVRNLSRELVCDEIQRHGLKRLTLDFDGSVQSTKRKAQGTAMGYNKKKKGERSYYPLFCTLAQTAQIFDLLHRPGNVHDSKGALEFVRACIFKAKSLDSLIRLESRMDAAFFSETLLDELNAQDVEFSVSVPFARFPELKKNH